ncbi:hypothetical protein LCGC14_2945630, partial [marine sediment metagenome]
MEYQTRSPGNVVDDASVGTVAWSNPDNAKTSNDAYATTGNLNVVSHYLKATNFGFSIPTGSTINGIIVEIEKWEDISPFGGVKDSEVKVVKSDGTIGSTNKADTVTRWPTPDSDTYISSGTNNDLWGEVWTAEDINDIDFGAVLAAVGVPTGPATSYANVDHIQIT